MPDVSKYRPDVKFWLVFAALAMVIFMLARPQFGSKMETVKRQGVETVVALDISNSMLAQDVTPSRLEKSKKLISRLVETFNNDKVAMIVLPERLLHSCLLQVTISRQRCFLKQSILHLSRLRVLILPEP